MLTIHEVNLRTKTGNLLLRKYSLIPPKGDTQEQEMACTKQTACKRGQGGMPLATKPTKHAKPKGKTTPTDSGRLSHKMVRQATVYGKKLVDITKQTTWVLNQTTASGGSKLPNGATVPKMRKCRLGVRSLHEIRMYQKSTEFLIRKLPLQQLIREITKNYKANFCQQAMAIMAIQHTTEVYLVGLFEFECLAAIHTKCIKIMPKDIHLVRRFRKEDKYKGHPNTHGCVT